MRLLITLLRFLLLLVCVLVAAGTGLCSLMVAPAIPKTLARLFSPGGAGDALPMLGLWVLGLVVAFGAGWLVVWLARGMGTDPR